MKTGFPLLFIAAMISSPCLAQQAVPDDAAQRMAREVVALTNNQRATEGLPPLKLQENLRTAAFWLANDMATNNYFSHTDKQGRDIAPRIPGCGYRRYREIAENIAAGQVTPAEVVAGWLKSPGHRQNMMNGNMTEVGVGYAFSRDSKFQHFWVQDFGTRFNTYPVVINGEQPDTKTPQVHLYIYGEGWAQQMRLSNDGKNWTLWEPYNAKRDWKLEAGSGERTVYVEIKKGEMVRTASDTISLLPPSEARP